MRSTKSINQNSKTHKTTIDRSKAKITSLKYKIKKVTWDLKNQLTKNSKTQQNTDESQIKNK